MRSIHAQLTRMRGTAPNYYMLHRNARQGDYLRGEKICLRRHRQHAVGNAAPLKPTRTNRNHDKKLSTTTCYAVRFYALQNAGFCVDSLHGDKMQRERTHVIDQFKSGGAGRDTHMQTHTHTRAYVCTQTPTPTPTLSVFRFVAGAGGDGCGCPRAGRQGLCGDRLTQGHADTHTHIHTHLGGD